MSGGVTKRYELKQADCTICAHEQGQDIDRALVLKEVTQVQVAKSVGCSKMSVSRHYRNHLLPKLGDWLARQEDAQTIDILAEVKNLYLALKDKYEKIGTFSDPLTTARFHAELRKDLELLGKITGEIETAKVKVEINTEVTQQFLTVNAVILAALAGFPDAKAAVVEALGAEIE